MRPYQNDELKKFVSGFSNINSEGKNSGFLPLCWANVLWTFEPVLPALPTLPTLFLSNDHFLDTDSFSPAAKFIQGSIIRPVL
jgi:hypothetical protein